MQMEVLFFPTVAGAVEVPLDEPQEVEAAAAAVAVAVRVVRLR